MNNAQRHAMIEASQAMHAEVEQSVLKHPARRQDDNWQEKQRLLLADMALHLLQTALTPGALQTDKLKNNLHAILTISDQFLPHAELKRATDKIYFP